MFGRKRLSYFFSSSGNVTTDLLYPVHLIRPCMVVRDTHWMNSIYGLKTLLQELDGDKETHSFIRFFSVGVFHIYKRKQVVDCKM